MQDNEIVEPDRETILVVDDEPTIRMLVTETLKEHGYITFEAGDAPAALGILKAPGRISLLLTDITLPGQNGRELAEAAKQLRPELKILFMTGYAHNIDIGLTGSGFGGANIITKPFSLDGLVKKISAIIA
ncbi:MAG: response regulator [Rhodospirillales bacterium]|nr:response regulator [Rhodospirillales bacterium]